MHVCEGGNDVKVVSVWGVREGVWGGDGREGVLGCGWV